MRKDKRKGGVRMGAAGVLLGAGLCVGLLAVRAEAVSYGFTNLTNNGNADVGSQLFVDVSAYGAGMVQFHFGNSGPTASSITAVYFDDGALLGLAALHDVDDTYGVGAASLGVDFSVGASPGDLPGGNAATPAFVTTAGFLADSDPPTQPNGVNPGEWLDVFFTLQDGKVFSDVLGDLDSGALRVGLHVQAIGLTGGSDSYINNGGTPTPVPEPASLVLLGSGLIGLAGAGRRRFRA